jgi:hypothetical protein
MSLTFAWTSRRRRRAFVAWSVLAIIVAITGTALKIAASPAWPLAVLLAVLVVAAEGIRRTGPDTDASEEST